MSGSATFLAKAVRGIEKIRSTYMIEQNPKLDTARHLLLPKLMSGEIEV